MFLTSLQLYLKDLRIKLYDWWKFIKFRLFQRSGSTPASLYRVAAALCDERVIDLLSLCTFVGVLPSLKIKI